MYLWLWTDKIPLAGHSGAQGGTFEICPLTDCRVQDEIERLGWANL